MLHETAKELYTAARGARAAEDWNRCKVKATAAWGVYQARAPLAALLGECELRLGEHVEAARHLALSLSFDDLNPKLREHTQGLLDEAKQHVAVLDISVDGAAADAPGITLLIDGKSAEEFPLYLSPGSHTVEARHAERGTATQTLTLEGGTEGKVNLTLKVESGGNGEPGSGETAAEGLPYWPGLVLGGVGLVGVGVGVGLMVAAGGKRDDADALEQETLATGGCGGPCADVRDAFASADTLYNASTGMFVAGGVLTVGAVAYLLIAMTSDSDEEATATAPIIIPTFGPKAAGLSFTAAF